MASDVIEPHFHDKLRLQGHPFGASFRAPATGSSGGVAREARRRAQSLPFNSKFAPLLVADRGGEADVIEFSRVVVQSEKKRPDVFAVGFLTAPPTTQSAVRRRFTLIIARSAGRYGPPILLQTTPSVAPLPVSDSQSFACSISWVYGDNASRLWPGSAPTNASSSRRRWESASFLTS